MLSTPSSPSRWSLWSLRPQPGSITARWRYGARRRRELRHGGVAQAGAGCHDRRRTDELLAVARLSSHGAHSRVEPIAAVLDYYMLGRLSVQRGRPELDGVLFARCAAGLVIIPNGPSGVQVVMQWTVFVVGPFAAGRAVDSSVALTRELRANAERLEREQEARARSAAAEERTRIARELHDVIAHSLSVMVIQTVAAREVAPADPSSARGALAAVQVAGREALLEMRQMIGVLRHGDVELAGSAAPGSTSSICWHSARARPGFRSTLADQRAAAGASRGP